MCTFPAEFELGDTLPFFVFWLLYYKQVSFSLSVATFFTFLLVISLSKMMPECGAKVLSSVPKHKKAVMCSRVKMCIEEASFRHEL